MATPCRILRLPDWILEHIFFLVYVREFIRKVVNDVNEELPDDVVTTSLPTIAATCRRFNMVIRTSALLGGTFFSSYMPRNLLRNKAAWVLRNPDFKLTLNLRYRRKEDARQFVHFPREAQQLLSRCTVLNFGFHTELDNYLDAKHAIQELGKVNPVVNLPLLKFLYLRYEERHSSLRELEKTGAFYRRWNFPSLRDVIAYNEIPRFNGSVTPPLVHLFVRLERFVRDEPCKYELGPLSNLLKQTASTLETLTIELSRCGLTSKDRRNPPFKDAQILLPRLHELTFSVWARTNEDIGPQFIQPLQALGLPVLHKAYLRIICDEGRMDVVPDFFRKCTHPLTRSESLTNLDFSAKTEIVSKIDELPIRTILGALPHLRYLRLTGNGFVPRVIGDREIHGNLGRYPLRRLCIRLFSVDDPSIRQRYLIELVEGLHYQYYGTLILDTEHEDQIWAWRTMPAIALVRQRIQFEEPEEESGEEFDELEELDTQGMEMDVESGDESE